MLTQQHLQRIEEIVGVTVGVESSKDVVIKVEVPKHFQIADTLMEIQGKRKASVVVLPKVSKAPWKELLEKIPRQKVLTLPRGYQVTESTCSVPVEVWWMYPLHTVFLGDHEARKEQNKDQVQRRWNGVTLRSLKQS